MPLAALLLIMNGVYWIYRASKLILILAIIARVVGGLGLAVTSMVGVDYALSSLQTLAEGNINGLPVDVKAILDISGITTILKWVLDTYVFTMLLKASKVALRTIGGMYNMKNAGAVAGGSTGTGLSTGSGGTGISNF